MEFGPLLKSVLKENHIYVSHFAEDIGYNRVAIYSVFNGEKQLPEKVFRLILEKYDFSAAQQAQLIRAFHNDSMSEEKNKLMKFNLEQLEALGKKPTLLPISLRNIDVSAGGIFLAGSSDYYSALSAFLENEAQEKETKIYTNYSFFDLQADDIVYSFILGKNSRDFLIHHTVRFDDAISAKEKLRSIYGCIKFAKEGHETNVASIEVSDYAFSTYFIGKRSVLLYDDRNDFGFLTTEEATVKAYIFSAVKHEAAETSLTRFTKSPFELKSILQPNQSQMLSYFSFFFPLCLFSPKDMLDNTLKKEVPNREMILSACWNHLKYCQETDQPGMFTQLGTEKFFESGKTFEASNLILKKVSFEDRKRAFEILKDHFQKPNCKFTMLNSNLFKIDSDIEIEVYEGGVIFNFPVNFREDGDYIGAGLIFTTDQEICDLFKEFREYLIANGYALSAEFVENFLDNLISQCDAAIEEQSELS